MNSSITMENIIIQTTNATRIVKGIASDISTVVEFYRVVIELMNDGWVLKEITAYTPDGGLLLAELAAEPDEHEYTKLLPDDNERLRKFHEQNDNSATIAVYATWIQQAAGLLWALSDLEKIDDAHMPEVENLLLRWRNFNNAEVPPDDPVANLTCASLRIAELETENERLKTGSDNVMARKYWMVRAVQYIRNGTGDKDTILEDYEAEWGGVL